jgi:hypothetical protein
MAAVRLRLRSIHGRLLRNGGGLDWLYLLYAPSEFRQLLLGQAFRLRSRTKHIDLRPVEPSKLTLMTFAPVLTLKPAANHLLKVITSRRGLTVFKSGFAKVRSTAISTSNLRSVLPSTSPGFSPCQPAT